MEPFVKEVVNWEQNTVCIQTGKKGQIFRPNLTLFIYLKLRRASEIDLMDVSKAISACPEKFDEKKFLTWADQKLINRFLDLRNRFGI